MKGNQNNNLGDIEDRLKQSEDQIKHIDDIFDRLHKTVAIFEGRHMDTVEKMKEVTVLASNIQVQVKEQEQKMVEQSSNDLNQIRNQIQDIENQNGISSKILNRTQATNLYLRSCSDLKKALVEKRRDLRRQMTVYS